MATFGWTIAGNDAGDVVVDEVLVEVCEEVAEMLVGATAFAREEADEWIEDDKTGVDPFHRLGEAGKILWDGKRTSTCGVRCWIGFLDGGEDFDRGVVCSEGCQELELGGGIGVGADDDNACDPNQSLAVEESKVCRAKTFFNTFFMQ